MKNYYKVMGLKTTATDSEIKSTYRLLAKRFHPDVNPGNAVAAEKFAALGEAYETLGDPTKRAEYDRQLAEAMQAAAAQQAAQAAAAREAAYAYGAHPGWQQAYAQNRAQSAYTQAQQTRAQSVYTQAQYARNQFVQQQAQMQQWLQKINEAQHEGFAKGHDAGFTEARVRFGAEIEHLKSELDAAKSREADYAAASDRFRKRYEALESEYASAKTRWNDKETRLNAKAEKLAADADRLKKDQQSKAKKAATDNALIIKLKAQVKDQETELTELKKRVAELEKENGESTGRLFKKDTAITDLKLEITRLSGEKKYFEEEYNKLKTQVDEKEEAIEMLNQTVAQWEDFSASLDTAEAMKSLKNGWDKQMRDLKKKLKNTHYGTLGVLYIATDDEIKEAFRKLVKKYTKKAETDKEFETKLFAVNEAAKILTDPEKRAQYNAEIGVTDEEIAAFAEEKSKHEESMDRLEREAGEQEFWAYVEDLMYNAQTGDVESQNTLGEMYFSGEELERDAEQAVYWFKEAAKAKHPEAFYNLGVCFLTGDGTDMDVEKGKGFIKQAAKLGSKRAEELIEANFNLDEV